jgi:geranylgeranyl reductase family protein
LLHDPEVLVIGAGPGGTAAAWALAGAGHDVLMVDWAEFPRDKTCGDGLTPMAVGALRQMGVLPRIETAGATRIDDVRIAGPFGLSARMRFADHLGPGTYALTLPRVRLDDILRQYAVEGGAGYMGGVRVEALDRENGRIAAVQGTGPDGPVEFRARHVIIAVGANMGLLRRAGLLRHRPRLIRASRAYFENVHSVTNSYEFFFDLDLLPGYGWIFPTGNGTANVGVGFKRAFWAAHDRPTSALLDEFVARRTRSGMLKGARRVGPVKGYPLRVDFSTQRVAGANWVLVGESAGLVNPVTGEGIDLAIESGLLAAETVHADIRAGRRAHGTYQHRLRARYLPLFTGLRILRDILVTPLFFDYVLLLMKQYRFLTRTVIKIAQGCDPPLKVFHPLFILQFFMPISPQWVWQQIKQLFDAHKEPGE